MIPCGGANSLTPWPSPSPHPGAEVALADVVEYRDYATFVEFNQLHAHRALRLHPLKGNRAGLHAMTLTGNYRLIVERISEDEVRVLDVEDYHGD